MDMRVYEEEVIIVAKQENYLSQIQVAELPENSTKIQCGERSKSDL